MTLSFFHQILLLQHLQSEKATNFCGPVRTGPTESTISMPLAPATTRKTQFNQKGGEEGTLGLDMYDLYCRYLHATSVRDSLHEYYISLYICTLCVRR